MTVAAREEAHAEGPRPPGGEQVPDAVSDHDRVRFDAEPFGGGQEEVGVGLCVGDLVPGHDRDAGRHTEQVEDGPAAVPAARRDRPGNLVGSGPEQLRAPGRGRTWSTIRV